MRLDRFVWNLKVLRSRLASWMLYLWYAPRTYRNWAYMIASKFDSNPGTLILRDGSKFRIRPKTSDRATINEVFIAKPYTPDESFAIGEGDHILDIGANIGAFTVYAARIAKEEGIVYGVEPVASNFSVLEENVKLNDLQNVRLLRAAVGGHKGFAAIESRGV